jgi:hypothetical protein
MTTKDRLVRAGLHTSQADAVLGLAQTGITATGSSQTDAYALSASNSSFSTVALNTGAVLPSNASVGDQFWVQNLGANPLSVYPPSGGAIDSGAANAAKAVAAGKTAIFKKLADAVWAANLGA